MDKDEKAFFENLVVPESNVHMYWKNKRYTKEELLKIKNNIKSLNELPVRKRPKKNRIVLT